MKEFPPDPLLLFDAYSFLGIHTPSIGAWHVFHRYQEDYSNHTESSTFWFTKSMKWLHTHIYARFRWGSGERRSSSRTGNRIIGQDRWIGLKARWKEGVWAQNEGWIWAEKCLSFPIRRPLHLVLVLVLVRVLTKRWRICEREEDGVLILYLAVKGAGEWTKYFIYYIRLVDVHVVMEQYP